MDFEKVIFVLKTYYTLIIMLISKTVEIKCHLLQKSLLDLK